MLKDIGYTLLYGAILISLVVVDFCLGNGFLFMIQKTTCKITCIVKKYIRDADLTENKDIQTPFHYPTLFIEFLVLLLTFAVLNKVKHSRGKDRLDDLIHESKEALRLSNEFLEKWRMRRVPGKDSALYSYLDEEPQEIKPLKLEVPILHMAIVDARGATRKLQERGDAGDSVTCTDSAVLSVVSLYGEDDDSVLKDDTLADMFKVDSEQQNRYLWDVEEEDPNVEYY